jgi:hypothetical protein
MRDILKFKGRIKPLMGLSMDFMRANPELFMMQDTIFNLQMAAYWIQEAAELSAQGSHSSGDVDQEGPPLLADETPKVTESTQQLAWVYKESANLARDIYKFMDEVPLSQIVKLWLLNAITRITEAKFAIQITAVQYDGLQNAGGASLLSD